MIIDQIKKNSIKIGIVGFILVGLISMKIEFAFAYLFGFIVSYINLCINESFLDISGTKGSMIRNLSSYMLRMLLNVLVLALVFKFFGLYAMFLTFVGCLTIRISILIIGLKEV